MSEPSIQDAIEHIAEEKGLSVDQVMQTIEAALAAAYRKDFGSKNQNIRATFEAVTGNTRVFDVKTVVEDMPELPEGEEATDDHVDQQTKLDENGEEVHRFNPRTEIQITDAKAIKPDVALGEEIVTELEIPSTFGRMAAQTAKQVIIQKLREAERQSIFDEFKDREGSIIVGTIYRRETNFVIVDFDRATAIMPPEEQIERERYSTGNRFKFFIKSVEMGPRGPQIIVSRAHPEIVHNLFQTEIPEIANGSIEIKAIAREAGSRSKVAVHTEQDNIDPIGSCVGQRGARIQTIIGELNGEKVDIILWDAKSEAFIENALAPAKIIKVELREQDGFRLATVTVTEDQLSLAIGKGGQNVRLASKLSGWKIDIVADSGKTADDFIAETEPVGTSESTADDATAEPVVTEEPATETPAADAEPATSEPTPAAEEEAPANDTKE